MSVSRCRNASQLVGEFTHQMYPSTRGLSPHSTDWSVSGFTRGFGADCGQIALDEPSRASSGGSQPEWAPGKDGAEPIVIDPRLQSWVTDRLLRVRDGGLRGYKMQVEYLRLQPQDESDNSESIHVRLSCRDF